MVQETRELDWLIDDGYVPSSVERKKALLMYFFVGIIAALSKEEVSVYEMFHLKQSLGRWTMFFIFLIGSIIFVFIPYLWVLPVFVFIIFLIIWIVFAKQAREWRYTINETKILMPLFAGLWWWIVTIFELDVLYEDE
jgi:hypothetical protein